MVGYQLGCTQLFKPMYHKAGNAVRWYSQRLPSMRPTTECHLEQGRTQNMTHPEANARQI